MREFDRDEVYASHGHTPLQALTHGHCQEDGESITVLLEKEPIAMFGVAPTQFPELGGIWLLGTDKLYEVKRDIFIVGFEYLKHAHETYPALFNIIDIRHEVSIHYCVKMGFVVQDIGYYDTYEKRPFALLMRYK
jgi:hypothetical protein